MELTLVQPVLVDDAWPRLEWRIMSQYDPFAAVC